LDGGFKGTDAPAESSDVQPRAISPAAEQAAGSDEEDEGGDGETRPLLSQHEQRRFSTLESIDSIQDLESATAGGSARRG